MDNTICIKKITQNVCSNTQSDLKPIQLPKNNSNLLSKLIPPTLSSQSYILIDADTGMILAEKNSTEKKEPASLTKMLSMYIISEYLSKGQLSLDEQVTISKNAWLTQGSRTFVEVGKIISVETLIKGVIIQSGNDACMALAEHTAGSPENFANIMNQKTKELGMINSHFTDPAGLPNPDQYTTAKDMVILARALVKSFPQYYPWYKEKSFTFNGITQYNRNKLLWQLPFADGIKTGHTESAGFSLASSAIKNNMRLISITMQAPSEEARTIDAKSLLLFGFNNFDSHTLFSKGQKVIDAQIWYGIKNTIPAGTMENFKVTLPKGKYNISASLAINKNIKAPVKKGDIIGKINVKIDNEIIATSELRTLEDMPRGNIFKRTIDVFRLFINKFKKS
jgi:D-alanyl-D-alanine carboxypeptidase (penicillin-binding protein 5/6)